MGNNDNTTVFVYTSLECLMRQPWRSIMVTLIDRGVMNLVCCLWPTMINKITTNKICFCHYSTVDS